MSRGNIALPASLSFAQQVSLLEKKRAVLSGLTQLIISLEQLRAGLEAVLLLGGNASALTTQELRSIEVIRQRVISLSDLALHNAVYQLDTQVSGELEQLVAISLQLVDDIRIERPQLSILNQHANRFNRNARTLIAMRVLLGKRGEVLPPLQFPLPKSEIESRLQLVESHEQSVRQQAVEHIEDMRADISLMLSNPACSESQNETFSALNQALADNLQHIKLGLSLSELPMPIDDIEVNGAVPNKATTAERNVPKELQEPLAVTNDEAQDSEESKADEPTKRGRLKRMMDWLNSPWNEGWKSSNKPPK